MSSVVGKLMTAEEFYDWANRPEHSDRYFELDHGEIVEMPAPGKRHGLVCLNVGAILWNYTRLKKRGYACSNDAGILLERDPDTVCGPDVTFYLENRSYSEIEVKYSEVIPALIVEVLSPSDRWGRMLKRINEFLARGVQMVWLLDPEAQTVSVWRTGQPQVVFESGDELGGFELLPDFRCRVSELFAMPESESPLA